MNRNKVLFVMLFIASFVNAQVPRWAVHPNYSNIELMGNGYYVVTKDNKIGIIDSKESVVVPIEYDSISSFRDHLALLYKDGKFVAYTNDKGNVVDVSQNRFKIKGDRVFIDSHLLVYNETGYYFINGANDAILGPYAKAYPFSEGYAKVIVPKSKKHIMDGEGFEKYLSKNDDIMFFPIFGNAQDDANDMVDFVTSVSNGKSIVVVKKRVYEFDMKNNTMVAISLDGTDDKKARVFTKSRPVELRSDYENGYYVPLQKGQIEVDSLLRLRKIIYDGNVVHKNTIIPQKEKELESSLNSISYTSTNLFGISYNRREILPAQFHGIKTCLGNEAVVKSGSNYGVIKICEDDQYQIILNNNDDIGFEHKTAKADIKIVCPPFMDPALVSLSSEDENCQINVETRKENKNVETSMLSYECLLNMPEDIDQELTPANITVSMNYDGLKFVSKKITFNTWYINNYSLEAVRHPISNSILSMDIIIKNNSSDTRNYYKNVTVESDDSIVTTIDKITEGIYNVKIFGWKNDLVRFNINIMEDGCPTITYPFRFEIKNNTEVKQESKEKPKIVSITKSKSQSTPKKRITKEPKKIYIPN